MVLREARPQLGAYANASPGRGHAGDATRPPAEPAKRADWWLRVHILSLVAATLWLLVENGRQWFFGDEWAFIASRGLANQPADIVVKHLFNPHNEHWSTLPVLIWRFLITTVGLSSYLPYVAIMLTAHALALHFAWRLMRRSDVSPAIATAVCAMIAVIGAGTENLLWAFQLGFILPITCGFGLLLLVEAPGKFGWRDVAGWGLAIAALMSSGVGISVVILTTTAVLLRRGWRIAALTAAVPATAYMVWFETFGKLGVQKLDPLGERIRRIPLFVARGLVHTLGYMTTWHGAGRVITVIVFLAVAVGVVRTRDKAAVPLACLVGAVAFFTVISQGRDDVRFGTAIASRYIDVAALLLTPAIGFALTLVVRIIGRRRRPLEWIAAAGVAVLIVPNLVMVHRHAIAEAAREQALKRQMLAAAALADRGGRILGLQPDPVYDPDAKVSDLVQAQRDNGLPRIDPTPGELLVAESSTQLSLDQTPVFTPGQPAKLVDMPAGRSTQAGECLNVAPVDGQAVVAFDIPTGGAVLSLRGGQNTALGATLASDDAVDQPGPERTFQQSSPTSYLSVGAAKVRLTIRLSTPMTICGITS